MQASFLGCSSNATPILADNVESATEGSSPAEVVLASPAVTPVFSAQPLFLSALVRQDGLRSETTLLGTQATSTASLSLTLSKPLFLYLCKLKVLKALSLCSLSFAEITSSSTEALPQALVASLGKDGLCGGSAL